MERCKSRKLYTTVISILEDDPKTRSSDKELILSVYKKLGIDTSLPFAQVLKEAPPLESITRCRRKAQQYHPMLLGVQEVEEQRCLNEQEYKKWATTI